MRKNNFIIIPTLVLILLIIVTVAIVTPIALDSTETPIATSDDTRAYYRALAGLELAVKNGAGSVGLQDFQINLPDGGSCSITVTEESVSSTATFGKAERTVTQDTGFLADDIVFLPGDDVEVVDGVLVIKDKSNYENEGTLSDAEVEEVVGPFGTIVNAIVNTANKPYVQVSHDSTLDLRDEGSMAMWVNLDANENKNFKPVIVKGDGTAVARQISSGEDNIKGNYYTYGLFFGKQGQDYYVILRIQEDNTTYQLQSNTVVNRGEWVHVGASWDQTNGMRIYLNGQLDAEDSTKKPKPDINPEYDLFVGNYQNYSIGNNLWVNYYPILLKRDIFPVEVESLYLNRKLYYELNGLGAIGYPQFGYGRAIDETVFVNHGVLYNGVNSNASDITGASGTAYAFNSGLSQHLNRWKLPWDVFRDHSIVINLFPSSNGSSPDMNIFEIPGFYKMRIVNDGSSDRVQLITTSLKDDSGLPFTLEGPISKDNWHSIVLVVSYDTATLYIDTVAVDSSGITTASLDPSLGDDSELFLGSAELLQDTFHGKIDNFTVFGHHISYDKVQEYSIIGTSYSPAASWNLNELSGSTFADSINSYDFTGDVTAGEEGVVSSGVSFDKTQELYTSSSAFLTSYPFTVNMWVKTSGNGEVTDMPIFDIGVNDTSSVYYRCEMNNSGFLKLAVNDGVGEVSTTPVTGSVALNDGNWHMITAIFRTDSLSLYVDSNEYATANSTKAFSSANTNLVIGSYKDYGNNSTGYQGIIDEIKVYQDALSISQVKDLFETVNP